MKFPRCSGILLHPTSLPGGHGLGDLGAAAHEFVAFLKEAKAGIWQMLPLGPTGFGDSPYQCFSAFAGNPLLISLDDLVKEGWLEAADLVHAPPNNALADYEAVIGFKQPLLRKAAAEFLKAPTGDYETFCAEEAGWLEDFALFMACKEMQGMVAWPKWGRALATRDVPTLKLWRERLHETIATHKFVQWVFFRQFARLRTACHQAGIRLMGDIPIYAAHDSADTWARPDQFLLKADGDPAWVAGVPPDYFSETGQLWGNPIYDWSLMEREEFAWWIERFRATFRLFDSVRVDHFRGFEAYWQVAGGEATAQHGQWISGPGAKLFEAVEKELGDLAIVAENLGVITPQVEAIRHRFGFPGMAVLQFAFGSDSQSADFKPHNYPRDVVAYTGTHDNDTTVGWWTSSGAGASTRSLEEIRREREWALEYLGTDGREIHWTMIRALMASVASTVLFPVQDLLGLGTEARMNIPSTLGGNWRWRLTAGQLTPDVAQRMAKMAECYDRVPPPFPSWL